MFLSFLAATLVALGLMSGAMGFSREFLGISALVLGLDLFIGLATMGRVSTATSEDIRFLQGMNRLRHAYHETVPGLESYFITGHYDDVRGIFAGYGADVQLLSRRSIVHGFTTVVGMLGVINAALSVVLLSTLAILVLGESSAIVVGVVAFIVVLVITVIRRPERPTRSLASGPGSCLTPDPSLGDRPDRGPAAATSPQSCPPGGRGDVRDASVHSPADVPAPGGGRGARPAATWPTRRGRDRDQRACCASRRSIRETPPGAEALRGRVSGDATWRGAAASPPCGTG
jgi:hypothetical protein